MKRILLNSSGLKVSRPGFDVTTATPAEMSLDTSAGKVFSIFLQGSVPLSAFTVTQNQQSGNEHIIQENFVVNFGQILAAPPIVLLTQQDPILSGPGVPGVTNAYANMDVQSSYGGGNFAFGVGGGAVVYYTVTTTTLTINYYWVDISYSPPNPAFFNYSILRTS